MITRKTEEEITKTMKRFIVLETRAGRNKIWSGVDLLEGAKALRPDLAVDIEKMMYTARKDKRKWSASKGAIKEAFSN